MAYDFDRLVDRRGTASVKWDYENEYTGHTGLLPLWVADMDFPAPGPVMDAIRHRVDHGVFGYVREPDSFFQAARGWMERRHGWGVPREWIVTSPSVLSALSVILLTFTSPGDGVVIQPPVYHPFGLRIRANGRRVVENPLVLRGGKWEMDLDGLERVMDAGTRMLILCSPHNPAGRVWERSELERLAGMCRSRGVLVVSDEIHFDLVLPGHRHTPLASLSPESAANTITLVAPTKTFNLAGLGCSLTLIASPAHREKFEAAQSAIMGIAPNAISVAAAEAGWRHAGPWLDELLVYLQGNYGLLKRFVVERLPSLGLFALQGTYLALVDFGRLGLSNAALREKLLGNARVWLDDGVKFGRGAEQMQRMNLACPRSVLKEALERMAAALGRP
ncbi:MAG TPA: MalY/PatB family protein [bacterium]|nr:MalY/PatB family protein [bacterium]